MIFIHDRRSRQLAFFVMFLVLGTVGRPAQSAFSQEEGHEELVVLTEAEMAEFNVQIAEAGPGVIILSRRLPGEVKANDNHLAHIGPRYRGIVTDVRANVGDTVKKGQVLAVVESNDTLSPYELKTFIAGTIIQKHMTLGEPVSRETEGFVVADLGTVWMDITIYQRDLDLIRVGEEATIRAGSQDRTVSGKISYVTPVVDEHTRTATARIVVANPDGFWRPGMFVMAEIKTGEIAAGVVVPSTAVHTMEGRSVIFVEADQGFHPQPVTIGNRGSTQLEITSGLESGTRYVSVGGFVLKAEMGKDSLGEGHAH